MESLAAARQRIIAVQRRRPCTVVRPGPSSQATHNAALPVWEKLLDSHYKLLCTCFVAFIGNMATGGPRPVKVIVGTGPSSWV
jgi:hypothetical protein